MTSKPSHGFILWAVPRFHRPAQAAPIQNTPAPSIQTLLIAARPIEVASPPASGKTAAGPTEAGGYPYAYH